MYIVPFTCLAVFNLLIYTEVRRANSARSSLTRLQKKEIGLANLLMVVVMVFFVCNILALVVNILEVFEYNIIALHNVSNLLVTFNSSVNLIIYCIFGEKFKRIFCQLFCHRTGGRGDGMQDHPFLTRYPHPKVVIIKLQLFIFNWSLIWNILIIISLFYICVQSTTLNLIYLVFLHLNSEESNPCLQASTMIYHFTYCKKTAVLEVSTCVSKVHTVFKSDASADVSGVVAWHFYCVV